MSQKLPGSQGSKVREDTGEAPPSTLGTPGADPGPPLLSPLCGAYAGGPQGPLIAPTSLCSAFPHTV